jgi:DnaK suppressor protein
MCDQIMNQDHYRQKLIAKEQELLGLLSRLVVIRREDQPSGSDTADQSTFAQEEEFRLSQAGFNSGVLAEVRAALKRIDAGKYGECLADGEPIAPARLKAVPWASYCIEHQNRLDCTSVLGVTEGAPLGFDGI